MNRRRQAARDNNWQHNPQHRGNAPYGDRDTANKFGGQRPRRQRWSAGNRPGGGNGDQVAVLERAAESLVIGQAAERARVIVQAAELGLAIVPVAAQGPVIVPAEARVLVIVLAAVRALAIVLAAVQEPETALVEAAPERDQAGGTAKNQVGNRSASSRPSSASHGGGFGGGGSGNHARASSSRGGQSMGGGGMSRGGRWWWSRRGAAAEAAAAGAAAEDDGDNRTTERRKDYENKTKQCDFIENDRARRSDPRNSLPRAGLACSVEEEGSGREANRRARNTATRAKGIRHAETGRRRPYSGSGDFRCRRRKGNSGPGRRGYYQFRRSGDGQESGEPLLRTRQKKRRPSR